MGVSLLNIVLFYLPTLAVERHHRALFLGAVEARSAADIPLLVALPRSRCSHFSEGILTCPHDCVMQESQLTPSCASRQRKVRGRMFMAFSPNHSIIIEHLYILCI